MLKLIRRTLAALALGIVLAAGTVSNVQAQMGMMMMGGGRGGMDLGVNNAEIERYAKQLNFKPEQLEAAKLLLDGYTSSWQEKLDAFNKEQQAIRDEARETGDMSVWQKMGPLAMKLRSQRSDVQKEFMTQFRSVLTTEQAAAWPKIEMARRRSEMRGGMMQMGLSGQRVDLTTIIDRLDLSADEMKSVTSALEAYEPELDGEIVRYNDFAEKSMKEVQELMKDGGNFMSMDPDKMSKMFTEGRDMGAKIRDINRKYARQIASLLPETKAGKFDLEFRKQSFPEVYRERYAQRAIAAAEGFDDLDAKQKEAIAALKDTFTRELTPIQKQGEELTEKTEMEWNPADMMRGGFGGQRNEAAQELRRKRSDVENKAVESLKAILTDAQKAKLPANDQGGGPGGDRGPGARGGQGGNGNNADPNNPQRPRRNRPNGGGGAPQPTPGT